MKSMQLLWRVTRFSLRSKATTLRYVSSGILAFILLAGLAFLGACGSSSSSSSSRLAYIAAGQNVYAYRIKSSGAATAIIGSPFLAGVSPASVVVHPSEAVEVFSLLQTKVRTIFRFFRSVLAEDCRRFQGRHSRWAPAHRELLWRNPEIFYLFLCRISRRSTLSV